MFYKTLLFKDVYVNIFYLKIVRLKHTYIYIDHKTVKFLQIKPQTIIILKLKVYLIIVSQHIILKIFHYMNVKYTFLLVANLISL